MRVSAVAKLLVHCPQTRLLSRKLFLKIHLQRVWDLKGYRRPALQYLDVALRERNLLERQDTIGGNHVRLRLHAHPTATCNAVERVGMRRWWHIPCTRGGECCRCVK